MKNMGKKTMWKPGKLIWKHMENTYGEKTSNMKHYY
jgi:hypothetical protein